MRRATGAKVLQLPCFRTKWAAVLLVILQPDFNAALSLIGEVEVRYPACWWNHVVLQ